MNSTVARAMQTGKNLENKETYAQKSNVKLKYHTLKTSAKIPAQMNFGKQ